MFTCGSLKDKVKKLIEPELTMFGQIILIFTKKLDNISHGQKPVIFLFNSRVSSTTLLNF